MPAAKNVLEEALKELKVVNEERGIKFRNKTYSMVVDRVEVFRKYFGHDYSISTQILNENISQVHNKGTCVVFHSYIQDKDGRIVATGHAAEIVGAGKVNSTSAIENCETSAMGRALAAFGLHGGEFASGDEISSLERKSAAVNSLEDDLLGDPISEPKKPEDNSHLMVSKTENATDWQVVVDSFEKIVKIPRTIPQLTEVWRLNNPLIKEIEGSDTESFRMIKSFFSEQRDAIEKGAKDNV